jgi:guanylate kinase
MAQPPIMSAQDRIRALDAAKAARQERSALKARLRDGSLTFSGVIEIAAKNPVVAKMRVVELLESIPGYGKIRAQALMEKSAISPTRRIQGLGKLQMSALLAEFSQPSANRGKLFVLSGPGGVGKSSVAKALRTVPEFWISVSATTRAPRFNEVDGVDYHFYSNEKFDSAIEEGLFLEWAAFAGNRYGTPAQSVQEKLDLGLNVLLEIEIDGARQVKAKLPHATLIFLEPPSWEELVSRLEGRGTDSPERRATRLALAQEELAAASYFDTVLINDRVEEVVSSLIRLATL